MSLRRGWVSQPVVYMSKSVLSIPMNRDNPQLIQPVWFGAFQPALMNGRQNLAPTITDRFTNVNTP